jgi:recombination protein RecT
MSDLKIFNQTIQAPATQKYIADVLGEKKSSFCSNLTSLVANDKKLQACEPVTLLYAGIKATALNLPLDSNLGFAYVIPYKNRDSGKTEAQFQVGWRGIVQLAIRSGQFKTINVTDIREGELKEFDLLSGAMRFEANPNRDALPIIGYVAHFELVNGFKKSLYMTSSQIETHAVKYSQTYSSRDARVKASSKWTTEFDLMAKKTVLKLLLGRYAPLSVEMQQAVKYDQSVIRDESGTPDYVDNEVEDVEAVVVKEDDENGIIKKILEMNSEEDVAKYLSDNGIAFTDRIQAAYDNVKNKNASK